MSSRDKKLLVILTFVIILAIYYFTIFQMQENQISTLEEQVEIQNQQLQIFEDTKDKIFSLKEQKTLLIDSLGVASKDYLSKIEQEEIILLLNEILIRTNVEVTGLTFSETFGSDFPSLNYDTVDVSVYISGGYDEIINFMSSFWRFDQNIYISNVRMQSSGDIIDSSLVISFVRMNNEYTEMSDLFEWYNDNIYQKDTPFTSTDFSNIFSPNYFYIGTDVEFYNPPFEGFNDTYNHWAEDVFNVFGRNGFILGDEQNNVYPDSYMTRLETVLLLDKVFRWELSDDIIPLDSFDDYTLIESFSDIEKQTLLKAYNSGYLFGYDDNTLKPNNLITYKELVYIGDNILGQDSVTWRAVANDINEKFGYESNGLNDLDAYATKSEIVNYLFYIDNLLDDLE